MDKSIAGDVVRTIENTKKKRNETVQILYIIRIIEFSPKSQGLKPQTERLQSPPDDSYLVFSYIIWHGSGIMTEYYSKTEPSANIQIKASLVTTGCKGIVKFNKTTVSEFLLNKET